SATTFSVTCSLHDALPISIGAKVAVPHLIPYTCAKYAAAGFSEGLRAELASSGVVVTTIAPGLMRTGAYNAAEFKGDHEAESARSEEQTSELHSREKFVCR